MDPEALARLVLRCREFSSFLGEIERRLPRRDETPFLYGQLDDAARKLQSRLARVAALEDGDERGGILRRLARKRRPVAGGEPRIDLQGNAWTIPVTELVNFLSHSGKSGVLWVTTSRETFLLEFNRGNLVHATSDATPREFRLGAILLREKLLEADQLEIELAGARSADDPLGSHLVRSGRLTPQQLRRALSIQVQELFHRLMDAENAIYRFQEGVQMLRAQELAVNITQLLLESARKKDEERRGPEPSGSPRAEDEDLLGFSTEAPPASEQAEEVQQPGPPTARDGAAFEDGTGATAQPPRPGFPAPTDSSPARDPNASGEPAPALPGPAVAQAREGTSGTVAVPEDDGS